MLRSAARPAPAAVAGTPRRCRRRRGARGLQRRVEQAALDVGAFEARLRFERVGVNRQRVLAGAGRFGRLTQMQVQPADVVVGARRERIEIARRGDVRDRLVVAAERGERPRVVVVRGRAARVERERALEGRGRVRRPPVEPELDQSLRRRARRPGCRRAATRRRGRLSRAADRRRRARPRPSSPACAAPRPAWPMRPRTSGRLHGGSRMRDGAAARRPAVRRSSARAPRGKRPRPPAFAVAASARRRPSLGQQRPRHEPRHADRARRLRVRAGRRAVAERLDHDADRRLIAAAIRLLATRSAPPSRRTLLSTT